MIFTLLPPPPPPPPGFYHYSVTYIISVFYARRTGFPVSSQCAVMHYIILYFNSFYRKINAFSHFYRKNQCVQKTVSYILYETFLSKSNVFCHKVVKKTSCRTLFTFSFVGKSNVNAKSMRFAISIVKTNAFQKRIHIYSIKLFLANLMCFVTK